jgi:predicted negative regulator of RcsB-dependent stress response
VSEEEAPKAIRDRNQKIRDEAAQKRKSRRDSERRAAVSRNLGAAEMVDDALARGTQAATSWLKRHFNKLQWVIVAVAVGGIGSQIYRSRVHKVDAKATDALMAGVMAELGRVGTDEEGAVDPSTNIADPRQHFADDAARLKAAEEHFRAADGSPTLKTLAQLGLAGVLYDEGKTKDALAVYRSVHDSALAKTDTDVRLRSTEGAALAEEALGNKDAAKKGFKELESSDVPAFVLLGLYHQARLAFAAGERDAAKELLKKVIDKAGTPSADTPPGFAVTAAKELLATIDPNAVPKQQLTPEQIQALMQQAAAKQEGQASGDASGITKEKLNEILNNVKKQQAPASAPSSTP